MKGRTQEENHVCWEKRIKLGCIGRGSNVRDREENRKREKKNDGIQKETRISRFCYMHMSNTPFTRSKIRQYDEDDDIILAKRGDYSTAHLLEDG